jgi:hypothetical protein
LTIKETEEFNQKKIMYEQPFRPKRINDFNTVDGLIKVNLSNENEIYFQNIIDNTEINENLMSEIIKSYKGLFELLKKTNEKMQEIGYLWKKLESKSKLFFENNNTYTSYQIMKEVTKDWTEMNKRLIVEMSQNIVESFRYIKNEYSDFKPFAKRVKEKKDIFFKDFEGFYFKKIETQKKNLSVQEKIEKFNDIDFTQISQINTQSIRESKNFYCGYLNSFTSEYERLRILNGKRIKESVLKLNGLLRKEFQEFSEIIKGRELYYDNLEHDEEVSKELKDNYSVISSQLQ